MALHLSCTQAFMSSLVEVGPVFLEKKIKMFKVYRKTDGWTVDHKSSLEL